MLRAVFALLILGLPLFAQPACPATPAWSPCDLVFALEANEKPDAVELRAEFRSPHHKTYLVHAFRDGDRRLVIRFSPTEAGAWDYRLLSSAGRFDGKLGQLNAAESDSRGFVKVANVHHFQTENNQPHLWMATGVDKFLTMPRTEFNALIAARAKEKFTHLRVTLEAGADLAETAERIRAINGLGLTADIAFFAIPEDWKERERYISDVVARLAAFNITWAGFPEYERVPRGRALLKDAGTLLQKLDPYQHPRTTMAEGTSAALAGDGWMNMVAYGTTDANIGGVEHQFYQSPALATGIANTRDLWNATMNGQYPATAIPDEASAGVMKIWYEFMQSTRHWELEPFFDVDNGRGLQLEGIEYVIYVEKPGVVTANVEKHGYDVEWFDPATGERSKVKDACKNETCTTTPPSAAHDWVLHISRESTKAGMLKSVKFDSREEDLKLQDVEGNPDKIPFDIAGPDTDTLSLSKPAQFSVKMKRQSKALQHMTWLWTGEVTVSGRGYRVIATSAEGTFRIPANIAESYPAALHVKLYGMNGLGKVYTLDRNFTLAR